MSNENENESVSRRESILSPLLRERLKYLKEMAINKKASSLYEIYQKMAEISGRKYQCESGLYHG